MSNLQRVFAMKFSSVYPFYLQKAEKKGRPQAEVDRVICWRTGYTHAGLEMWLKQGVDFETFFAQAPALNPNPNAALVKGVVCGVRVEAIEDPLMQQIRYLDKLVDELAKGRSLDKVLRS